MVFRLPSVYPITDKKLSGRSSHLSIIRDLIRGGASVIQIRDKETPDPVLLADMRRCVEFASRSGVRIIVNDRCDLALLSGACGVHLGQEDLPAAAARRLLGPRGVLGFSTHSLAQVQESNSLPVQYIGFGPIFATATKANPSPAVGLAKLKLACRRSHRPVVAIGGLGPANIRDVLDAGASSAAVISALMSQHDIARRMEELLKAAGA
jgi:thiamine-phosphate pyrophosphorylase